MNDDQDARRLIRQALDETLVVEAAAGTGKTTELVGRIVRLIETGAAKVSGLVAVTFTEKAAGELKLRLRQALEEARAPAGDAGQLERAVARLEEAQVGTIHAFCTELLRERSVEAGVDPEFVTMDEVEAKRLFARAFDHWFAEQLNDPPPGIRRALRRWPGRRFAPGSVRASWGPWERIRAAGWSLVEWRDFPARWRPPDFDRDAALLDVRRSVLELADRLERSCLDHADKFFRDLAGLRDLAGSLREADEIDAADADGVEGQLVALLDGQYGRRVSWPSGGSAKNYRRELPRDALREQHKALIASLRAFKAGADAQIAASLQSELQGAIEVYEGLKRRTGRVDFVDLLLLTRNLLRDDAHARAAFQERFTHILIDEFQDTDPLQAEILLLLASNDTSQADWRSARVHPGKLFLVADPKQSIYRFRRADVGTYLEVKDQLLAQGARCVQLSRSFRAVPNIQRCINATFEPEMTGDRQALAADYVPLTPHRRDAEMPPSVVALPVPRPYGAYGKVTKAAIEASLPRAVGAFVAWVVQESGWSVVGRDGKEEAVQARHVCLLFRRMAGYFAGDVGRTYTEALEARGVRHLLVGGRSFHKREEVEVVRTALTAIEWPDDELSVFATLRGPLFAVGDEALLVYRSEYGRLNPLRLPDDTFAADLEPLRLALRILAALHRRRNRRSLASTLSALLEETRAHAALVLRPAGEQALANVLHLVEMARRFERGGGVSFRGFVEYLIELAAGEDAQEAPILEEESDGVRLMTVHKAKGLEFPIVVLADPTAGGQTRVTRVVEVGARRATQALEGWRPAALDHHQEVELRRQAAEDMRLAYVAATRARDLLVVPVVGSERYASGWLAPFNKALYPLPQEPPPEPAPGCPAFGTETVVAPPNIFVAEDAVQPGQYRLRRAPGAGAGEYRVVWWDAALLDRPLGPPPGIRHKELLEEVADDSAAKAAAQSFAVWTAAHRECLRQASQESVSVVSVTDAASLPEAVIAELLGDTSPEVAVEVVAEAPAPAPRVGGRRFGTLVHAVLATVPLDASPDAVAEVARLQSAILGALPEEESTATTRVLKALDHPLLKRALASSSCHRETPVTFRAMDMIVDGVVDLAFEDDQGWHVVDFKTDIEIDRGIADYTLQLRLYARGLAAATRRPVDATLLRI